MKIDLRSQTTSSFQCEIQTLNHKQIIINFVTAIEKPSYLTQFKPVVGSLIGKI